MSYVDISNEFSEFGRKMKTLGIIMLLDFIISLIAIAVLPLIAIAFPLIGYLSFIFLILSLYFIFTALKNMRNAGEALNNQNLLEYRSKFFSGYIIGFVGNILIAFGGGSILYVILLGSFLDLGFFIIGYLILIVGAYLQLQAWKELIMFFGQNGGMFPDAITYDANRGANHMKSAAICDILSILVITVFIAFILRVLGYFKLGKFEEIKYVQARAQTPGYQPQPTYQPAPESSYQAPTSQPAPQPTPTPVSTTPLKYCPHCGAEIEGDGKFCGVCGAKL